MNPQSLATFFRSKFGTDPEVIVVAPGRINLIGEHTDYNDGFVFPVAIDRQLMAAASRNDTDRTRVFSEELGEGLSFDARTVQPGDVQESWSAYGAGMAWILRQGGSGPMPNLDVVVASDVPIGSGVSSSAALELAFGVLWNDLTHAGLTNPQLALLGQRCENEFVGVKCGIMDQMASAMGKEGQAMFLDTRTLEITYAPVPEDLLVVLMDTKTPRQLTDSAYNERRSQCEAAAAALGVKALRDATPAQLEAQRDRLDPLVYKRAKHVVTENERCKEFVQALHAGDKGRLGELMRASHESLRDDYQVSSLELDAMSEAAWEAPGCVGARMTGAGFGGACVALAERDKVDEFIAFVTRRYKESTGIDGELLPCKIVEGARVVSRG